MDVNIAKSESQFLFTICTMTSFDDFGALQTRMNDLTVDFDAYINRTRTEVITSKQDHYGRVTELKSRQAQLEMEISALQQKEKKVKDTITRTLEELQVQQLKVDELRLKEQAQLREREELQKQMAVLLQQVRQAEDSLRNQKLDLQAQLLRDHPELAKFEHYLGLRIEAIKEDCVRFIFYNVFWNDVDREVYCQLNVGDDKYVIDGTSPVLEAGVLDRMESLLNENKNFGKFLKRVREELRDAADRETAEREEAERSEREKKKKEEEAGQEEAGKEEAEKVEEAGKKQELNAEAEDKDLEDGADVVQDNGTNDKNDTPADTEKVTDAVDAANSEVTVQQDIIEESMESPDEPMEEEELSSS